MGILNKLFSKKENKQSNSLTVSHRSIQSNFNALMVHTDLQNLLWIADGPQKNYIPKDTNRIFEYEGIRITFSSFSSQEPSLMSVKLPIQETVNPQNIDRPPYYPTYASLTDEQRGVYWKLLSDPYSGQLNIGYVFILYYGLERHLLEGDYEQAFRVILKLRDVYDNASFQSYSACALILTCLTRQRADLALEFYNSIDKSYELNFSDNLYLLCKIGLKLPLTASDIIRMAKTFEFTNQNYIKKYPDLFLKNINETMQSSLKAEELDISKYVTATEWKKLRKQAIPVFANMSIREQTIDIPFISENFKLKKVVYDLLEQTHEKVKADLAKMRKDGTAPVEAKAKSAKVIEILSLDTEMEKELLKQYNKARSNAMTKHFALIALQDFYYKYRDIDSKYLQICIDYCNEDIALLPQVQSQYIKEEKDRVHQLSSIYSKREVAEQLSAITAFNGNIPAFKRLAIIFEKNKEYSKAITVCKQAIAYYGEIGTHTEVGEFEKRMQKIEAKASKL